MEEIKMLFKGPICLEKIPMILDLLEQQPQTYIEDCAVCCNSIQISYNCENAKAKNFQTSKAYG